MQTTFTCLVRNHDGEEIWTRVAAEDAGIAVTAATAKLPKGKRWTVNVYRGDHHVPARLTQAPAVMATIVG